MSRTRMSRFERGFASFDALLSAVPIVLMVSIALQAASAQAAYAESRSADQLLFDRLVSVADYTVKAGAVMRGDGMRSPNWLDERLLTPSYAQGMSAQSGAEPLYIGASEPEGGYRMCIYRIVVYGTERSIGRLFVCGG